MSTLRAIYKKIVIICLRLEARLVLRRHKPKIIGITGTVGKTTTKEAIATLLSNYMTVWKSPKSYNSEVGLPLAILGLENAWHSPVGWIKNILLGAWRVVSPAAYPVVLVLEMGVDRPGDFDEALRLVRPDVAVVTAIGNVPVHVEYFEGPDAVAKEKEKLVRAVSENGYVILNADDARVAAMGQGARGGVITYGMGKGAHLTGSHYKLHIQRGVPAGISFRLDYEQESIPIKASNALGVQAVYALLAAAAVGIVFKLNVLEIGEGLEHVEPVAGRFRILRGIQKSILIDDSYNASPIAVEAALVTIAEMPATRKIAVLGDMLELGKFTSVAHKEIGEQAAHVADVIVAVGVRSKFMEDAHAREFHWFPDSREAAAFLKDFVREGDLVLVKGSQGVRMERVIEALLEDPDQAKTMLVRQDAYWKNN